MSSVDTFGYKVFKGIVYVSSLPDIFFFASSTEIAKSSPFDDAFIENGLVVYDASTGSLYIFWCISSIFIL